MRVRNWQKFQHYHSGRCAPPWIKLYRDLLNDKEWFSLPAESAKFLVSLWLLAAETDGELPDSETIAFRLRIDSKLLAKYISDCSHWIIFDASKTLSECKQLATPETEVDAETEVETEKNTPPSLRSGGGEISVEISTLPLVDNSEPKANGKHRLPCPYKQILALYDKHLPMCPRVIEWTDTRKKHLSALWHRKAAELGWKSPDEGIEYFDGYFEFVAKSPFLTGRVDGRNGKPPFVANLEWLVTPSRFANVVEGKYHA